LITLFHTFEVHLTNFHYICIFNIECLLSYKFTNNWAI
jgi:hypothetical protein